MNIGSYIIMMDSQKNVTLSKEDKKKARELVYLSGIPFSQHVRDMIDKKLKEEKDKLER